MVVPACSALLDFSELDDGTGAACDAHCDAKDAVGATDAMEAVDATDALKDVAIEAAAPDGCNSKGGPRPVRWVGVTKEGMPQPLCIDSTEVTMSQYQDFLDALKAGATPSVAGACAFNAYRSVVL